MILRAAADAAPNVHCKIVANMNDPDRNWHAIMRTAPFQTPMAARAREWSFVE